MKAIERKLKWKNKNGEFIFNSELMKKMMCEMEIKMKVIHETSAKLKERLERKMR